MKAKKNLAQCPGPNRDSLGTKTNAIVLGFKNEIAILIIHVCGQIPLFAAAFTHYHLPHGLQLKACLELNRMPTVCALSKKKKKKQIQTGRKQD